MCQNWFRVISSSLAHLQSSQGYYDITVCCAQNSVEISHHGFL
uniref:Uncharacterized protein n=1 Tax=Solanum lycopersicum TaxID=4081 RepID=K4B511_SOLLC